MMKFASPLSCLVIFTLIVQNHSVSEKRLCVDEKCVGIISLGRAIKNYSPNQQGILPLKAGTEVKIKSKSSDSSLWGVEIEGKDGYAPKIFIQEYKVFSKKLSLVEGIPEIPPPKRSKSKLKSSEKSKQEAEITTTAPLPTELGVENIITDVVENVENTVNVTPTLAVNVVDGTKIPVDVDGEKKLIVDADVDEGIVEDIQVEATDKDDDEEEYDDDDDDDDEDDDEFNEEEGEELVEQEPSLLKADIVPGKENQAENKTEIPSNILNPNLVQTESKPETEHAADIPLNETISSNDTPTQQAQPLSMIIEEKKLESAPKQDSGPSPVIGLEEKLNNVAVNEVQSDQRVESLNTEPKTEVVNNILENSTTETNSEAVSASTTDVPAVAPDAKIPPEIDISGEQVGKELVKPDIELPNVDAKLDLTSDVPKTLSNEVETETVTPSTVNTEEINETAKLENTVSNSAELNTESQNALKDVPPEQLHSTESAKVASPVNNVPLPSNQETQGALNLVDASTPLKEDVKEQSKIDIPLNNAEIESPKAETVSPVDDKQTENTPNVVVNQESIENIPAAEPAPTTNDPNSASIPETMRAETVPPENEKQSENTPTVAKQESTDQIPTVTPITNDLNSASTMDVQTVIEKVAPEAPSTNDANTLDVQTVSDQPAITNPTDTLELIQETTQAVQQDDSIIPPKEVVTTELPPVTLNELLKSHNTRFLNGHKHNELTNNNDLLSENEEVTEVPTPTEPDADIPNIDPFEFDVTTPNPIPPVVVTPPKVSQPPQQQVGLFQTILGTVKGFLPSQEPTQNIEFNEELDRILFPRKESIHVPKKETAEEYCERDVNCSPNVATSYHDEEEKDFIESLSAKVLELFDVLSCMVISAAATLLFTFGYYCLAQCRKENQLIAKLNVVERSLLASNKEASILKHDLGETCGKLASIENNSFGSNDMVIAIKKELEACEETKSGLQEQVVSLEKELENAAEAGLELNKIVSELLNNQSGDESIISSVEELQRQLNEQQHTILEINAILADKSRENSELQLILAEQNAKFGGEIASLQQDNDELEGEKNVLKSKLDEMKTEFEQDITKALEGKNAEIKRLQTDIVGLRTKTEEEHRKWQTSIAKVEALEECLKTVKRDPSIKVSQIIDVANVQAELLDIQRQRASLQEKLESEMDTRKLLEDQVKSLSEEVEKLKHNFHQSEKDKLEAQTRLEVLSNYFKDKENQLQKELSLKEAMWLKQQGETTSTVDRLTNMQEEIQTLKSQNDSLRAEIEAQLAAHKAQIGTLENRAHETWLAARQSERRYEEARSDATALRRKLTSLVGGNAHTLTKENNLDVNLPPADLNNAPSPVHMEPPGSSILLRMPPPPLVPPPFMGPPLPHFMGMPPFMPPEMRLPPMGRLMSPPPPPGAPHLHRYSPFDDDDDEDEIRDNSRGHWRDNYLPPRYLQDRYAYNPELISNYDTETDISPPPSPRERSHRSGSRSGSYKAYSPPPQSTGNQSMDRPKKTSKGQLYNSSGSENSYNSWKWKSKAKD